MTQKLEDFIRRIRESVPEKIAQEICSVQPINLPEGTMEAASEWLQRSRIARGVDPITEEKKKNDL